MAYLSTDDNDIWGSYSSARDDLFGKGEDVRPKHIHDRVTIKQQLRVFYPLFRHDKFILVLL